MLATIVLASFLCTVDSNNADHCQVSYEGVWQNINDYHKDRDNCITVLDALFPDDVINDPKDPNKFTFAGCYRVLPGQWVGLTPKAVYLQNLQDADDSFTDKLSKLEIK